MTKANYEDHPRLKRVLRDVGRLTSFSMDEMVAVAIHINERKVSLLTNVV